LKVLIADDDALSLLYLQDALQDWGYQVETAADGNSALDILQRPGAPLLAIVDGMMPARTGSMSAGASGKPSRTAIST
jgi:two-component system cell cycle response regulator